MREQTLLDWIALQLLPGVGPVLLQRALERFADAGEIAHRLPAEAFRELGRFPESSVPAIVAARKGLKRRAERELRRCREIGVAPIPRVHPDYPAALENLPDPPVLLYVRGELPRAVLRVAVIGSRAPTAYGRRVALGLSSGLAARGIEVVSGGARGIDSTAHRGALEEGGRTVAVLGSGFRQLYPPENAALFEEIAGRGALVSEFTLDTGPKAENFPRRNRIVSGLSAAVVVVEAARRSGTLITAGHALEQGREVLAVPGPVSSAKSAGCHHLIQQGAKLIQRIEDILDELPPLYQAVVPRGDPAEDDPVDLAEMSEDEALILTILDSTEPTHLDELATRVPLTVGRLQSALFGLQLRAAVEQLAGGYYLLRPRRSP